MRIETEHGQVRYVFDDSEDYEKWLLRELKIEKDPLMRKVRRFELECMARTPSNATIEKWGRILKPAKGGT